MRKLKDLEGKSIYIRNHKQKMDVLTYMELSGVTWRSGSLPTKANINIEFPLYLNFNDGKLSYNEKVDRFPIIISHDKVINYTDLNVNWYRLLETSLGNKFLYHIPTGEKLSIENHLSHGSVDGVELKTLFQLHYISVKVDHTLKRSDNIRLYRKGNELSMEFISDNIFVSLSDDGFKLDNMLNSEYVEIDEVIFKKP